MADFSEYSISWKFISEPKNGNAILSKVDAITNVVLSKAEKRVLTMNMLVTQNV